MTLDDFVRQVGLEPASPFARGAAPALRLRGSATADLGSSRLGGLPDLPAELPWPCWDARTHFTLEAQRARGKLPAAGNDRGRAFWRERIERYEAGAASDPRPLSFVAQLNCADLAASDLPLPPDGLLSFFYDLEEQPWGFAPEHAGAWRVVFTPPSALLVRRDLPPRLDSGLVLRPKPLRAVPTWTLPESVRTNDETRSRWEDPEVDSAFERRAQFDPEPWHQVGGHPDQIQGDMAWACALVTAGVYLGEPPALPADEFERLVAAAPQWRLLFQFASDDDIDLMWGDAGKVYLWMRHADIAAGAWDRAWLQLQCC